MHNLDPHHLKMLREESGISDAMIEDRRYRSITDYKELPKLGFFSRQLQPPGVYMPIHTTDGGQPYGQFRPDTPRLDKDGKVVKYETPKGQGVRLDCPPSCREKLRDPSIPLWITEGIKKGDALASRGACAVALMGVSAFTGKNIFGGITFLNDWTYIALNNGRKVYIVFDNDVMRKAAVQQALARLTEHLQRKGAEVRAIYLPIDGNRKIGADDFLAAGHTLADLEAMAEGPRPQPQPAQALTELLDDAPSMIRRPLALIDGNAYAAIWPYVKVTTTEALDKDGNIVKLNPPKVTTEQRLLIVRHDGRVFGDGGDAPLSECGVETKLAVIPPQDRLWPPKAVKAYHDGVQPDPGSVFRRLADLYDHYLDFSRSLSTQEDMCSLSACLSLMTWYSEAFDVLPYPWANGEWGSGKTKWGTIWAATSYLGQVLTLGGSFAALRDLADYGAAMLFDDAETIEDKKTDPDKKALLLAGNRRGMKVPLKEPNTDRTWSIRWVNAYCPRAFTAKKKPFGALDTRSLLIPLARTADSVKGNRDPVRSEGWPTPQRALQDNLWATSLMLLPEAKRYWSDLDTETSMVGRQFEVWRAPLAVARLFEKQGVPGLESTIRKIMEASTQEKQEEPNDHTTLTVRAIGAFCFSVSDVSDVSDKSDIVTETFTADQIAKKIAELAEPDEDVSWATARRMGWILSSLRLPKEIDSSTKKKARLRKVDRTLVLNLLRSYGLVSSQTSETSETSETSDSPKSESNGHGDYPDADPSTPFFNDAREEPQESEKVREDDKEWKDWPTEGALVQDAQWEEID